ncbi:tachykinin-like peptides receptor 99D [Rhopilema esculentum]|uniref:tachykinin-like peptides receptor 99D n=1 Tax=Rhopilema esculentum TaxID=499914 RepID=UPI0031E37646|eukprot:gene4149-20331_t
MALNSTFSYTTVVDFPAEVDFLVKCLFVLVSLSSFFLNGSIWYAVLRSSTLKTATNYLLLNMCLAHMIGAFGIQPFVFMDYINTFNASLQVKHMVCAITDGVWVYFVCSGVALASYCAVTHKRYLSITRFIQPSYFTTKFCIMLNALMWLIISVGCIPFWVSYKYSEVEHLCNREWGALNKQLSASVYYALTLVLPLAFLLRSYIALILAIKKAKSVTRSVSMTRSTVLLRAKKVLQMLVLSFLVCWSPFFAYWAMSYFTQIFSQRKVLKLQLSRIAVLFTSLNCCLDPVINIWGSRELRLAIELHWKTILKKTKLHVIGNLLRHCFSTRRGKIRVTTVSP